MYHLLRFFHLRPAETPTITGVALRLQGLATAAVTDLTMTTCLADFSQAFIMSYIYIANTVLESSVNTGYPFQILRSYFTLHRFTVRSMAVTFDVNGAAVKCAILDRCAFFRGLEQSVCLSVCVIKALYLRRNVKIVLVVH